MNHTAATALLTRKMVELLNKKQFVLAAFEKRAETIMIHVAALPAISFHLMIKAYIEALIAIENPTKIPVVYSDYMMSSH